MDTCSAVASASSSFSCCDKHFGCRYSYTSKVMRRVQPSGEQKAKLLKVYTNMQYWGVSGWLVWSTSLCCSVHMADRPVPQRGNEKFFIEKKYTFINVFSLKKILQSFMRSSQWLSHFTALIYLSVSRLVGYISGNRSARSRGGQLLQILLLRHDSNTNECGSDRSVPE